MSTPDSGHPATYITTPIYYVNDRPHIGHCYTTIVADTAARLWRLVHGDPSKVFLLTGTDEHAEKVVTTAAGRGLSAIEWADQNSAAFQRVFGELNISNTDFVRTTQERHKQKVRAYIERLQQAGDVYLGDFEGWYDVNEEAYVTETKAKEQNFLGDNGKPLVRRREQNYYFRLSKYTDAVRAFIKERVRPEARANEVLARVEEGLLDVPISRPVTDDPATQFGIRMPGDEQHRVYVWIDALFNYLSVVDTPERRAFWPATAHVMGKEIIWFHAVIWPAILTALGEKLPRLVYAHCHYTRDGKKMSKSLGNFIDLETIRAYTDRFGVDGLRWYLITQGPLHTTDADFSYEKFVEVFNADLANGIGNCASRVGNMVQKYFDGVLPGPESPASDWQPATASVNFEEDALGAARIAQRELEAMHVDAAVDQGVRLVRIVDNYINATRPFSLAKVLEERPSARGELGTILYRCAEMVRIAAVLLSPALPQKMGELLASWGCTPAAGATLDQLCTFGGDHGLKPGDKIAKGEVLFMRADATLPPPTAAAPVA